MKVNWNSKYTTISVYTIITFLACFAIVLLAVNFAQVAAVLSKAYATLFSIVWGVVIAFLLNPVMMFSEKKLKKILEKKKPHPKLCRYISTAIAIIFGLLVISALIAIIVPQTVDSIMNILGNAQTYMNNIYTWVNTTLVEYPEILAYLNRQLDTVEATVISTVQNLIPMVGDWAVKIKDGALGVLVALKDFAIGFIIAVYLLIDKEKFLAQMKRMVTAFMPKGMCYHTLRIAGKVNQSLNGFIIGKIIDSAIIGMICFISMTLLKFEYAVLISVIVGVTNVIPFFGPFIGAIPSSLLLLLSAPKQTLPFIMLIFVIQQFDGNILGPYILGDSTGLPAFWVMFAIFLGGGMFGFAGMVLGVPLFAVIYALVQEAVEYMLQKKGLAVETEYYLSKPPEKAPEATEEQKEKNK